MISNSQNRNKSPQATAQNAATPKEPPRQPYIDWIHCNVCYEQYKRKRRTFFLLACNHVVCQQCTKEVKESMVNGPTTFACSLCRQQTRACKMGNDMPPHLKELFHPEPYLDGLNTYRILEFQQKHRNRFLNYLERQATAQNAATPKEPPRQPYIDWIHCNVCYEQYKRKRRTFFLLACNHVVCQQCTKEVKESMVNGPTTFACSLCRQQTRACKMGNDMPPHLKELFHPEPYLDGLNTYRILEFQQKHRNRFLNYLERQSTILETSKEESQKEREQAKKCYQDLEEFKVECKRLGKQVIAIKKQRKEMEEKRNSLNSSSSSQGRHAVPAPRGSVSTSNSSGPRMPRPSGRNSSSSGVTSFSHHSSNHSFVL